MVQFNLLPDVKIEYIKTRYRKRLIMVISAIVSAVCFGVFILLFLYVRVNQSHQLKGLDKDIKSNVSKIQSTQDLDKILTIQNQLKTLPELHDKKVVASRLVGFLEKVTPAQATVSDVNLDFTTGTMTIKGNAADLITVNKFVDTLKFTDYKVNSDGGASGKAFKSVVLTSFSLPADSNSTASTYDISFSFDPAIFAQVKGKNDDSAVTLTVPSIISTRSETEKPSILFAPQPEKQNGVQR